jgi:lipopolysaccharide/colanic/teichoic acid biosynthesis glycosyltransferase/predicted ATP-grasp superfamily ATP-dependent carboligase
MTPPRGPHDAPPTLPALVLGSGYAALGAARSLGRWGVPVYAVSADPAAPALASRYWRGVFAWDLSAAQAEEGVQFLLGAARMLGGEAVLLPLTDLTAAFVAAHAAALSPMLRFAGPPADLVEHLIDKGRLYVLAAQHGVPVPRFACPRTLRDVEAFLATVGGAVAWKGRDPRGPGGTAKAVVRDRQAARRLWEAVDAGSPNVLLQEYLAPPRGAVWLVNAYVAPDGTPQVVWTGRKVRQYPPEAGVAALAVWEPNAALARAATGFLTAVGYRGPVDLDYVLDTHDGTLRLLDVNPRVGATFRLFTDSHGVDVVRLCYADLTGRPVRPGAPRAGRAWILEDGLLARSAGRTAGPAPSARPWKELARVREAAWWALDDPAPLLRRAWLAVPRPRRPRPVRRPATASPAARLAGAALLALLWPLLLVLAAANWLVTRRVFFRQERIGAGLQPFVLVKFQTMVDGTDGASTVTAADDPRLTPLGRWLRRLKLDELPELVNVLRGEMTFVGPRPLTPNEVAVLPPDLAARLYAGPPGLTGLATLVYVDEERRLARTPDGEAHYFTHILPHKAALELAYAGRRTWWTDALILLATPFSTLLPRLGERLARRLVPRSDAVPGWRPQPVERERIEEAVS